jgi:multiple sugar transport system permease protein
MIMRKAERVLPVLLLLPSILFLLMFFAWPLVEAILVAFGDPASGAWTLDNFRTMADDLNFQDALKNTFLLVVVVVPLQLVLAIGLAMLLTRIEKGRDLYLYVWTIPLGISDLAAGILWLAILGERGYLNTALQAVGVTDGPTLWLSYETPWVLFFGVVVAEIWRATAIMLVIIVAGVQLIPKEYGEAAAIFGASAWQRLVKVTLPSLKPSIQTALILRTILALEVFAVVLALGGTNLPVLMSEAYAWQQGYQNSGVAAAYAVVILAISLAATLFFLRVLRVRPETVA